jgi:FtsH-binding integral membrane protein
MPTYEQLGFGQGAALSGDRTRAVFGQVMGLVAFAMGFAALGAYIARNIQGGGEFLFFIGAIGCIFGLQYASARGREQLAVGFLFGMALLLGMAVSSVIVYYVKTNPGVVWQAAGATGLFMAALGTYGFSTRRDLSAVGKWSYRALWVVIGFGLITFFIAIPASNIIYCVAALLVFAGFTAFDFQRLARQPGNVSPVPIAASIFLDVFNVFILFLSLFGGGGGRRN